MAGRIASIDLATFIRTLATGSFCIVWSTGKNDLLIISKFSCSARAAMPNSAVNRCK
jgi:hypothetical protein